MTSILITGCNRGLGLGLVKALNKLPQPPKIFATCRDVGKAEELKQIEAQNENVKVLQIDLKNFNDYKPLVEQISADLKDCGLNVLFNNAGIGPNPSKLNSLNEHDLLEAFQIHTVAPVLLSKACLPLLKEAASINKSKPLGVSRAAIINMSAILASIAMNKKDGSMYAYRASKELRKIAEEHKNVQILEIDLLQFDQYERLVQQVDSVVKDQGLNVLFNNAGIAPKSTRINIVKEKDLLDTFTCNTVVPIMLTKAFLPLLKKASDVNDSKSLGFNRAAIINMSSVLGSIEQNTDGGLYAYRTSKSALNSATKSMSIDLKDNKILCVALHPGWVRTDMGGSKAPLDVETSCTEITQTILNFNENHNGGFYQYNGEKLPW